MRNHPTLPSPQRGGFCICGFCVPPHVKMPKRLRLLTEETDLVAFSKEEKVAPQVTDEDALQIITKRSQREQHVTNKGCHITTPRPLRPRTGHPHPSCKQDTFSSLEKATVTVTFGNRRCIHVTKNATYVRKNAPRGCVFCFNDSYQRSRSEHSFYDSL